MKASKIAMVALSLLISMQAVANQGKYLGKKVEGEKPAEAQSLPKVNLLSEDILKENPHLRNDAFWKEKNSALVIQTEVVKKELSQSLFEMAKGAANNSSNASQNNSTRKKKEFEPPKTALVGLDHHHKYYEIERELGNSHDPSSFKGRVGNAVVEFTIEEKKWATDDDGKSVLLHRIKMESDSKVTYDSYSDIIFSSSTWFIDSLLPLQRGDIKIYPLVKEDIDFNNKKFRTILKDYCVSSKGSEESLLTRLSIEVTSKEVKDVYVVKGMKCEA